jgi:hypothetical protein
MSMDAAIGGAFALLVFGLLVGWISRLGNFVGLGLAWILGMAGFLVALAEALNIVGINMVSQILVFAVGITGLLLLLGSTLGIASWMGARAQHRILGGAMRRTPRRVG